MVLNVPFISAYPTSYNVWITEGIIVFFTLCKELRVRSHFVCFLLKVGGKS